MRAKVRFPIGPTRAKVRRKGAKGALPKAELDALARIPPMARSIGGSMRGALRPAFGGIRLVGALRGVVWCAQRGSTGRFDARSKRRRNRRFERRISRRIGPHSRSKRSGPRVESHGALGSNRTGPSGRIALCQQAMQ